jgi:hypothetical protein
MDVLGGLKRLRAGFRNNECDAIANVANAVEGEDRTIRFRSGTAIAREQLHEAWQGSDVARQIPAG